MPKKRTPAQLDAEIAEALARKPAYEAAKAEGALLNEEVTAADLALRTFPRDSTGLPPESVRLSPEYRAAKAHFQRAFAALRAFNEVFVKKFAKEERAERDARYAARTK